MKLGFIVGNTEQHQVELSFDQHSGELLIVMDGAHVMADWAMLSPGPVKRYEFNIGEREKHRLSLQLGHGEAGEEGRRLVPRMSLALTPLAQLAAVQESVTPDGPINRYAANAAATT